MRDMFHNYDYHIDQKNYDKVTYNKYSEQLEINPNIKIVKDITGKEIGIRAYRDSLFKLYFFLEDASGRTVDTEVLKNKQIIFEVISLHHDVVYSQQIPSQDVVDDTIIIELGAETETKLVPGLYHLKLRIVDNETNISETIFSEDDSFLDII